jgi:hypothetical protein
MGFRKRKQQPQAFHEESARQRAEKDAAKRGEKPAKAAKKKTGSKRARK